MAYRLAIEGTGPVPILRAIPLVPAPERSGHRGPFTDRDFMMELTAFARSRCIAAGYLDTPGGSKNSWHWSAQILRRDAQPLIEGLTAYLADGDEQSLRRYMTSPPGVRARPGVGESWEFV